MKKTVLRMEKNLENLNTEADSLSIKVQICEETAHQQEQYLTRNCVLVHEIA